MDLKDVALLVTAITGLVSAVLSGLAAIYAARAKQASVENSDALVLVKSDVRAVEKITTDVASRVEEVHKATNGLAAALGEAKLAQGTAEGTAAGLQQGRDERRPQPRP